MMELRPKKNSVGWKIKTQLSWGHWRCVWCPQAGCGQGWEHLPEEFLEQPQWTVSESQILQQGESKPHQNGV